MQSKLIHKGAHFSACTIQNEKGLSLVVTKNRNQEGRIVLGDSAREFIDAIKSAIDKAEADSLCRALFNQ